MRKFNLIFAAFILLVMLTAFVWTLNHFIMTMIIYLGAIFTFRKLNKISSEK